MKKEKTALFCKLFAAEKKTSDNIRNELVSNFAQIGIDESMLSHATFVTDRGANIKKVLIIGLQIYLSLYFLIKNFIWLW